MTSKSIIKKLAIVCLLAGFIGLVWVGPKKDSTQETWYETIYNETVTIEGMTGKLKVLRIKNQIPLGKDAPTLPKVAEVMLKNYAQFLQLDRLSHEEGRDLFCRDSRDKVTKEKLDQTRAAISTHPQLFKLFVRYMVVFEQGDFKIMFPCSSSTPDAAKDSALRATILRWDADQYRLITDSNEPKILALSKHIRVTSPFELDKLVIK